MMNYGKEFEKIIKDTFTKNNICFDRFHDQTSGFKGSYNICDCSVYEYPNLYYFELKSTQSKKFRLENISENQLNGLKHKYEYVGTVCGVLIWFVTLYKVIYIPITQLLEYKKKDIKYIDPYNIKLQLVTLDFNYGTVYPKIDPHLVLQVAKQSNSFIKD